MNNVFLAGLAMLLTPAMTLAQSADEAPTTTDLAFLVGTWNLTHEGFDITNPGTPGRAQTSVKVCGYDLKFAGTPTLEEGLETYVEHWRFNEDYYAFDREAWMNLPSFPLREYRQTIAGRGVKVAG